MSATISKLTPTSLGALLCARICHDLISPVGALATAVEILDDESNAEMHEDALDLVRNSSRQAGAKLRYLRLALGAGGSAPGIIGVEELKKLVSDMYKDGKASIEWATELAGLEKNAARSLLNLVMLAVQAIPRGGNLVISLKESTEISQVTLTATGPKARLDPAIAATLTGKAPEDGFDGRTIQPFYTGLIIRELKGTIGAQIQEETVTFQANLPKVQTA